ncbi:hypothetical protein [Salisediminibacterium selenitireducens]|uniref:Uncharacterized protein n=1 Tax=Bacillus selenitireducens (strain ATCC 700615 / DSM 15326 / MLS10) TaxID=439292 RepID=D6XVI7_BACIE|nr:hypothetical protein [Salisediminibacterium selenitireducens]ADH99725.1 hypothetical protein Bsel_2221 [[Bacillus] selenitireducens MLS10]
MIVKDLVETAELLSDEVADGYYVMYERFENVDCRCAGTKVEEIECDPEEVVQILACKEASCDSLKSVQTFKIGEDVPSVDAALASIKENYSYVLKELMPLG